MEKNYCNYSFTSDGSRYPKLGLFMGHVEVQHNFCHSLLSTFLRWSELKALRNFIIIKYGKNIEKKFSLKLCSTHYLTPWHLQNLKTEFPGTYPDPSLLQIFDLESRNIYRLIVRKNYVHVIGPAFILSRQDIFKFRARVLQ